MSSPAFVPTTRGLTCPASAPSPLAVLELRSWARAVLVEACLMDWHEAIDGLQAFAVASGLVDTIGQDHVQKILSETFGPYRGADDE